MGIRRRKRLRQAIFLFLGILSFLSAPLVAQNATGILKGRVISADSETPLIGAGIALVGSRFSTKTDDKGRYEIAGIPPGIYKVEYSCAGFEDVIKEGIEISAGGVATCDVALSKAFPPIREQVTVIGKYDKSKNPHPGTRISYTSEELTTTPASIEDISRILNSAPGTSHISELSNELIVRGGSPWENGVYIDNIQIQDINHFQRQGGSGGVIGVLDISLIDNLDFYTGGFSSAYGDRMSSIIDVKFREGNREGMRARMNLNTAGFGGSLEGPFLKKRGSFILSLRRNYHDMIAKVIGYGVAPRFGDIHFKMSLDIDARNKLTLLNIYGDSRLEYDLETALEEGWNSFLNYKNRQNTVGLNWFASWGNRGYSNTSFFYSFFKTANTVTRADASSENYATDEFNAALSFRNVNDYHLSEDSRIEFGLEARRERLDFEYYFSKYVNSWENLIPEYASQGDLTASKAGIFFTYVFNPAEILTASLGLRGDYFSYNRHFYLSPRMAASLSLGRGFSLHGAFGRYYQALPLFLLTSSRDNRNNQDPRATHYLLGMRYEITENTLFSLELYDKEYRNLPLTARSPYYFVMDSALHYELFRAYDVLADTGIAYSRGIELLLTKKHAEGLYGTISASIFRSRYKDLQGIWRNRLNDNQYLFTLIAGYRPDSKWRVSLRWNYFGGVPYSAFDIEASRLYNLGILDKSRILTERYPAYHTLNMRVDREIFFKNSSLKIYLSVLNVYNRKNLDSYYWDRINTEVAAIYQSPILPIFGLEYSF